MQVGIQVNSLPENQIQETVLGAIPIDWEVLTLGEVCLQICDGTHFTPTYVEAGVPFYSVENVTRRDFENVKYISHQEHASLIKRCKPEKGDILMTRIGSIADTTLIDWDVDASIYVSLALLKVNDRADPSYIYAYSKSKAFVQGAESRSLMNAVPKKINMCEIASILLAVPISKIEQVKIAEALSDVDALIEALEKLIAKKRLIKKGAMKELLTGKRRLQGFSREWKQSSIAEVADCLDNLRVPLNSVQRADMEGQYPYCGANGVLDYINDYCLDDDVILMAEDGGYFDEYETRPIAYRMTGKIWVNNHAHILKAKKFFDNGFLYYSLVHKNILPFLASGTRAKLNKSELNKIEINHPPMIDEQMEISSVLSCLDSELGAIETKLAKARRIKQGMMQQLLTGRIRLV
tara:strand:- start:61 stop:1284 length:1224 start_codon:yes stop_codon:yes gene_type:complete